MSEFSRLRTSAGISVDAFAATSGFSRRTVYRWERGDVPPRRAALKLLDGMIRDSRTAKPHGKAFRFIDLFAGIGGLRRGFDEWGECVFTSEWDRYSQKTYLANYDCEHEVAGDITQVPVESIPEHDLLLAGFPCQPFSIAGVSKKNALNRPHGFADETQGTLFFNVAKIIQHHRPRAFLLENVKNLVNHDRGRTFEVIHRTLTEELGYQVHWKVINSKSFVPQQRERIFIVGFREKNDFTFADLVLPDPLNGPKLRTILHPEDGTEEIDPPYTRGNIGSVSDKYTLTDHLWRYLQNYADKHKAAGNGFGFGLVGPGDVARTLSARYYKDGSEILVEQKGKNPRRLTPRECARLMGFDEPGGRDFIIPVSDTQAYRQFGNAVVVPVVKAVAEHMLPWLVDRAEIEPERLQRKLALAG
ncbi:DNA (cytosine-5-)-methyltransferase [Sphingomonas sp. S-NIH.Pt1_0416]|uniref:DNA (cytosine-5-)-methyltransferase n=1 Tax=Sphingomonas sp. S-NIH.Pt1_0416 TaxID=1920123 RepID=UPI000F7DDB06|nr:DNA (cytosine-5-)-methyltransferase [Sphingomonas sp. S-NIH.Pt1_0416]RSU63263.1 DNA (cytosine-5-)-methyltransferase [Sphingomonas sp. S-NIH.Pt1_0416]